MTVEQPRKILIVEDSPKEREVLQSYLKQDSSNAYIFWEEALGEKGLAQLKNLQLDCVLLDYKLSDMNGLEFLNILTEISDNTLPVILLSENGDEQLAVQALKSGASDYLSKNKLNSQTLLWAVDNAIKKAELQRQLDERQQELEKSEASLRLALEAGRMGIWEWDIRTGKIRWDGNMAAVYGISTEEFGGTHADFIKLLYPKEQQVMPEVTSAKFKPGEKYTVAFRSIWPDGSIHWIEDRFEFFYDEDGQPVRGTGVATDITERKLAEEELARRKQQFETLAENSPDIIARVNRQLKHVYINSGIERVTGISPETFIGKTNRDLGMPDELCELWDENLLSVFETRRETTMEFTFDSSTGRQFYQSRLVPEFGPDGEVEYVLSTARNITQLKQTEEERTQLLLREQDLRQKAEQAVMRTNQLQTVTAALAQALTPGQVAEVIVAQGVAALGAFAGSIVILTPSGTELEVLRATGYPEELVQSWQRFPLDTPTPISDIVRNGELIVIESLEENIQHYPLTVQVLAGKVEAGSLAAIPLVVDGRRLGGLGLNFKDFRLFSQQDREFMLTLGQQCAQALERTRLYEAEKQAREKAEIAQKRLAFLANASVSLGASLDYQEIISTLARLIIPALADWCVLILTEKDNQPELLRVAHANPAKEQLLEEMLQRYPNPPAVSLKVIETGQPFLLSQVSEEHLENIFPNKEHREIVRSLGAGSVLSTSLIVRGKVIGMIGITSATPGYYTEADVPLLQELARRIAASLDNAVLYQQVQQAVQTQEELNQLKDLFISVATHELRNPLAAAKGYVQLLQRRFSRQIENPSVSQEELIASLGKNVEVLGTTVYQLDRMEGLLKQLVDFSRVQNKKLELSYNREANVVSLAQRVVEQQQRSFPDHFLSVETSQEAIIADFDEARLEQVLTNLVNNAIKYSPAQTNVIVGVEKRPLEPTSDAVEAVVWVRDEGYGISPEDQARIFERFYRSRSGATGKVEGLGLGLYISQEIVAQHGGRMWLESVPGKGSTFYFSIPL